MTMVVKTSVHVKVTYHQALQTDAACGDLKPCTKSPVNGVLSSGRYPQQINPGLASNALSNKRKCKLVLLLLLSCF